MRNKKSLGLMLLAVGLFASGASALNYAEAYEMDFMPNTTAGTYLGTASHALTDADGSGDLGPSGSQVSPVSRLMKIPRVSPAATTISGRLGSKATTSPQ